MSNQCLKNVKHFGSLNNLSKELNSTYVVNNERCYSTWL